MPLFLKKFPPPSSTSVTKILLASDWAWSYIEQSEENVENYLHYFQSNAFSVSFTDSDILVNTLVSELMLTILKKWTELKKYYQVKNILVLSMSLSTVI